MYITYPLHSFITIACMCVDSPGQGWRRGDLQPDPSSPHEADRICYRGAAEGHCGGGGVRSGDPQGSVVWYDGVM
jgi:hypothetical protein